MLAMVQTVAFILHKDRLFTMRGEKTVAFVPFVRVRAAMTMKWTIKIQRGSYSVYLKQNSMSLRIS
jgi:hypothetical protein